MKYKYSICHPDKPEIEYPKEKLSKEQVMELASNYDWLGHLDTMNSIKEAQYNPSLEFINSENNFCFTLTAHLEEENLEFSLWYKRPVKSRILFGLLGDKISMEVIDKWSFNKEHALKHLQTFLNEDFDSVERIMSN